MTRAFNILGTCFFALLAFLVYRKFVTPVPWPSQAVRICGKEDGAAVCRALNAYYFWLYAGLCVAYAMLAGATREFARPTLLLVAAGAMFHYVQPFTFSEIAHLQTYSYEAFIAGFYSWMALFALTFLSALLWMEKRWRILLGALAFTGAATLFFAFTGRGGVEQINPLIGGLPIPYRWRILEQGYLFKLCVGMVASVPVYNLLRHVADWIKTGKVAPRVWLQSAGIAACFLLVAVSPVFSLPLGFKLHKHDVEEAKAFVDTIAPKVDAYYKEHKQYPKDLTEVGEKLDRVPRLLDVYDYLAENTKGGFFLSREEKYCFIVPSPGARPGYWSKTNQRSWRFLEPDKGLEEAFESVCDESTNDVEEQMIGGHLGLDDPDDPYAQLGLVINQVIRPARTEAATPELKQEIEQLGYKDPDIYAKKPMLPPNAQIDPQKLLEELKKQPLRSE